MFCKKCGKEIKDGAKFCGGCGVKIEVGAPAPKPIEPVIKPSVSTPNPVNEENSKSKVKTGIIIAIAAVIIVIIVAIVVLLKTGIIGGSKDSSTKTESSAGSSNNKSDEKAKDLLLEKAEELLKESGKDMDFYSLGEIGLTGKEVGAFSYLIQDISGDGVSDMVIVYGKGSDGIELCADIYTIEDGEVVAKEYGLKLLKPFDTKAQGEALIYLYENDGNTYLCADKHSINMEWISQYSKGSPNISFGFVAYDCKDLKMENVTEYNLYLAFDNDYGASDKIEEKRRASAEKIGLDTKVDFADYETTGLNGLLGAFSDGIIPVCASAAVASELIHFDDYAKAYPEEIKMRYSVLNFIKDGRPDDERYEEFLEDYKERQYFELGRPASSFEFPDNRYFIFPDSATRLLDDADFESIANDKLSLEIARNEMYARYGYEFSTNQAMIDHFKNMPWYTPTTTDQQAIYNSFSDIEKKNIDKIKEYEAKLN